MKTNRWVFGAALVGSFVSLQACGGAGTYQIPNVEPVVKQKPEEDALEAELESDEASTPAKPATEAKPAEAKPAEAKPAEAKPAEAKPETKPAEAKPADTKAEAKPADGKAEPKGHAAAKPAGKK